MTTRYRKYEYERIYYKTESFWNQQKPILSNLIKRQYVSSSITLRDNTTRLREAGNSVLRKPYTFSRCAYSEAVVLQGIGIGSGLSYQIIHDSFGSTTEAPRVRMYVRQALYNAFCVNAGRITLLP